MHDKKKDIIEQLQKDIFYMQGFKNLPINTASPLGLGPVELAFPNNCFPSSGIHEFICEGPEYMSATNGFIAGLMSSFMRKGGAAVWMGSTTIPYPPGLTIFGIDPGKIIFIKLQKEKELRWVMEETLKCNGIAAVVGEIAEINFTDSRRFQLAVEQSRLPGFIIRNNPRLLSNNAFIARWKIKPLPSFLENDMPGIGFPRWQIELIKVRNGKPGVWQMEWSAGSFHLIDPLVELLPLQLKKKVG